MQSAATKAINTGLDFGASKTYQRTSSLSDQDQVNFSLELWKKAFKDACERLCPVRAGGHECGCLPVLARLVELMRNLQDRDDQYKTLLNEKLQMADSSGFIQSYRKELGDSLVEYFKLKCWVYWHSIMF
ncbi:hypothetical protein TEA_004553 [Camellia sinensis var. sinensis]|uniref:Uncharacterized protein n=1 Tax=Camellia sinensis var. sinensis TaxID=542762 RepID=A0A4S4DHD7_CAMSN|nr:hypothetical protein TEA_004553 [Camellia sinensis var. sinensis]